MQDYLDHPHRRFNPLADEWVLVSPHRTKRPWLGQKESLPPLDRPRHDPTCYLCPGNVRANGEVNPAYEDTYVFDNDFAAMLPTAVKTQGGSSCLFRTEPVSGECRVICFSPRHDMTLGEMDLLSIKRVVDTWADQIIDLGARYKHVQIFENKGSSMGASNPHPHGQIWASNFIPTLVEKEDRCQKAYAAANGVPLLVDLAEQEQTIQDRIVCSSEHWILLVPFWATWPFEYLLMPKRHVLRLPDLTDEERSDLAVILKNCIGAYDQLFDTSFPYSMGWHGAPTDTGDYSHWQLHAHFYPPLLRSATVRKFMVGFEMLAESQRDLTPEGAAARLRELV